MPKLGVSTALRLALPFALLAAVLALAVAPGLSGVAQADTSYTPDSYAARLLTLFNAAREQHGLKPVQVASGTQSVALGWSKHLAAAGALSHNPDLEAQLEANGSAQWTSYGENVGDADSQDPDGLFAAYMASPEHKRNVLTPEYRYIGNAVVFAGGRAWNTMDFVDEYAAPSRTAVKKAAPAPVKVAPRAPSTKPAVRHLASTRSAPSQPQALPHVDRTPARPTAAAPAVRWTRDDFAPRAPLQVQVQSVAAQLPLSAAANGFDGHRVLLLAAAAMLVMHIGGAWVGVATGRGRRRVAAV